MRSDNTPTIDQFRPAVLRVLRDGATRSRMEIAEAVADHMGLSAEVRAERIASGQYRYVNRINWACSGLTHAGLLERPKRAVYRITENGRIVDQRNLSEYSDKDMNEWQTWREYQEEIAKRKKEDTVTEVADEAESDPIEVMTSAQRAFNAQTETELRKRLQESSPEFFEKAVIDLLWAMGYGGTHGEKQHVGRSGDGGIDGIIRQDALGLTNVYIQAKRYADNNKVGDPEIRNFIGSLAARGASQGVFITTSSFLPAAELSADKYPHGKIVLIDGIKLTNLMLTYEVAVDKTKEFTLYTVDDDYFEEELA
ncbi:MAG: restriction endonuclease [Actinomycetaceae bacterium]|nr:restriction endonuclease [Actinomycetaceae bacterium]